MPSGSKPAKRGFKHEQLFTDLINSNHTFKAKIADYISKNIKLPYPIDITKLRAVNVKGTEKSDVNIYYDGIHHIGCSIKSAEANFNQLDRRWLSQWAPILSIPTSIQTAIQSGLDSMRLKDPNAKFVLDQHSTSIINFFSLSATKSKLFPELFTRGDTNLKIFVAYDSTNDIWHLAKMYDVIQYASSQPVTVTPRGVLYFGNSLSLQRKGGDGNITTPPKSSPMHPSNHLQFKIKPLSIISYIPTYKI